MAFDETMMNAQKMEQEAPMPPIGDRRGMPSMPPQGMPEGRQMMPPVPQQEAPGRAQPSREELMALMDMMRKKKAGKKKPVPKKGKKKVTKKVMRKR